MGLVRCEKKMRGNAKNGTKNHRMILGLGKATEEIFNAGYHRDECCTLTVCPPVLFRFPVRAEDTLNLLFMGNSHRIMGETPTNRASSRSHAVFTLAISSEREEEVAPSDDGGGGGDTAKSETQTVVRQCELTLVDLAGCERMYKNDVQG